MAVSMEGFHSDTNSISAAAANNGCARLQLLQLYFLADAVGYSDSSLFFFFFEGLYF